MYGGDDGARTRDLCPRDLCPNLCFACERSARGRFAPFCPAPASQLDCGENYAYLRYFCGESPYMLNNRHAARQTLPFGANLQPFRAHSASSPSQRSVSVGLRSARKRSLTSLAGSRLLLSTHQFSTRMKVEATYRPRSSGGILPAAFRRPLKTFPDVFVNQFDKQPFEAVHEG
jgi:hypothetical protein